MIDIHCGCGRVYHADESHIGKIIKCTNCGAMLEIHSGAPLQVQSKSFLQSNITIPAQRTFSWLTAKPIAALLIVVTVAIAAILVSLAYIPATPEPQKQPPLPPTPTQAAAETVRVPESTPATTTEFAPIPTPIPEPEPIIQTQKRAEAPTITPPPVTYPPLQLCAVGQIPERLRTGELIEPGDGSNGTASLTVLNGTIYDAAVRLVPEKDESITTRFFYIRAYETATVKGIVLGLYLLKFSSGSDWVRNCDGFLNGASYDQFDSPLEFKEKDGNPYHVITVTLNPVPNGNITKKRISREQFLLGAKLPTSTHQ